MLFQKSSWCWLPEDRCWWNVACCWRAALWAARRICWWCWCICSWCCCCSWNCLCAFLWALSWCWRWKLSKSGPKSNCGMSKPSNALSKLNAEPLGKCLLPSNAERCGLLRLLLKKNESSSSSVKKWWVRKMSWKFSERAEPPSNERSPNRSYCLRFSLSPSTSYAGHTSQAAQVQSIKFIIK